MAQVRRTLLTTAIAAAMIPATASGAGFALIQNSAKSGGTSYAGTAATPEDPATVFFNPAGMVRNEGTAVSAGVSYVAPEFDYEDDGSTYPTDGTPAEPTSDKGQLTNTSDEVGYPPNFYYMNRFDEDWAFGLAINAPFGSRTEYDDDWVGRYHSIESEIRAFNINANIAHEITDRVSVGFGVNAQRFEATLSSMVPNSDPAQGPVFNPVTDSELEIDGDSWGVGANIGLLADLTHNTQLGLAWRSKIVHRVDGDVTATAPDGSQLQQTGGAATLDTPSFYTMSLRHEPEFEERLAVLFDAAYTRWNRVDSIDVEFDEPVAGQPGTSLPLDFRDSWRGSLGLTWDQTEQLQLRTGFTFDQSAVKDSESRTPRVPDNDRRWVSLGAGYEFHNGLELDASYSHIFISDTKINNLNETTGARLNGEFDSSANIISLQATYRY